MAGPLRNVARSIYRRPPVSTAYRVLYEQRFKNASGRVHLFRGVFQSFDEARASAPSTRPLGYDNEPAAAMYAERPVFPEDYGALFWLARTVREGGRLFDYGGHTGGVFDTFRRLLPLPSGFDWVVYDVPAVVERGRRINQDTGRTGIEFTTDFSQASGCDILFASGSLQYVDEPLAERLRGLERLPAHLIINQTPLHDTREFVTLQNIGTAYCPYKVFARERFLDELRQLNYELVDYWLNVGKGCYIPTYPEHSIRDYGGAYLRLRN